MLQPVELPLSELGELAEIIPGPEPELQVTMHPIPRFKSVPRPRIIPVCEPTLTGNELKYVTQCIETNWISSAGRFVDEFEAAFAAACGTRYGIACANGTIALHLALATLGLQPGDEVLTNGGIVGTIVALQGDDTIVLRVKPDNVKLTFARGAVASKLGAEKKA